MEKRRRSLGVAVVDRPRRDQRRDHVRAAFRREVQRAPPSPRIGPGVAMSLALGRGQQQANGVCVAGVALARAGATGHAAVIQLHSRDNRGTDAPQR